LTVYTYSVMNQIDAPSARRLLNSRLNTATRPMPTAQPHAAERRFAKGQNLTSRELAAAKTGVARKSRVRQTRSGFEYVYELEGTQQQIDNSLSQLQSSGVFQLVSVALRPGSIQELSARQSASFGGGGGGGAQVAEALGDNNATLRQPTDGGDGDRHNKELQVADATVPEPKTAVDNPSADAGVEVEPSAEKVVGSKPKSGKRAGDPTDAVGVVLKATPNRPTAPSDLVDAATAVAGGVAAPSVAAESSTLADKQSADAEQQFVHRVLVVFRINDAAIEAAAAQEAVDGAEAPAEKAPAGTTGSQD
jgi:hypothetical protein